MAQMVVSYRTTDASDTLTNLLRLITARFGETNICLGVDRLIDLGDDRAQAVTQGIKDCQLLLLVVGPQWRANSAWLSDSTNVDRIAIETALREKTRIIPVLLDGATLLDGGALPPDVESLGRRNGINIHTDTFQVDGEQLCEAIQKVIIPIPVKPPIPAPNSTSTPLVSAANDPIITPDGQRNVLDTANQANQSGLAIFTAIAIPFRGEDVASKLLIGVLINLLPFFGQIFTLGYGIRIAERVKQNEPGLPEWNNWGGDLRRGFVVFFAFFLYGIILSVASVILPFVGTMLFGVLFVPVTSIATIRYVSEHRFGAFFDFSAILSFLTKNTTNALMLCLDGLILSFATFVVMSLTSVLLFIPSFVVIALSMILYYSLIGVWVKRLTV